MSENGPDVDPRVASPVDPDSAEKAPKLQDGIALCLSGGGYRAMLFHLGTLWRLNDVGYLPRLDRVSSVSGGSITAGALAMSWGKLKFAGTGRASNFVGEVVRPIRSLANRTIDVGSVISGALLPGSINDKVEGKYRRHLFGDTTLQDLPDTPRFVFNATNVQSAVLWRFSKPYMGDYRVGRVVSPTLGLAQVVAASSAFPPVLSPAELDLDPGSFTSGTDLKDPAFRHEVVLSDGGVYDNLGLETAFKRYQTLLVSDAGGRIAPDDDPPRDWARHMVRILAIVDHQVRNLRKRQLVGAFRADVRSGAYWGIRTPIRKYSAKHKLHVRDDRSSELALVPTRLKRLEAGLQERLINWGYAITDAAMRTWVDTDLKPPKSFPYPKVGV